MRPGASNSAMYLKFIATKQLGFTFQMVSQVHS
jgi:hypothetical protein